MTRFSRAAPFLILLAATGLTPGCTPTPPGLTAEAVVAGPIGARALRRSLETEPAVTNVAPVPGDYRHISPATDAFTFSPQSMAAARGTVERTTGRGRTTRVTARITWPRDHLPTYRQQADLEDLARRLVGRALLEPTDDAATPQTSRRLPSGPTYWSGD